MMVDYIDRQAVLAAVMAHKWQNGTDGAAAMEVEEEIR